MESRGRDLVLHFEVWKQLFVSPGDWIVDREALVPVAILQREVVVAGLSYRGESR
jgi:hypothetical protein